MAYRHDTSSSHSLPRRLGWFVLIWAASTTAVMGLAECLHALIPH